MLHYDEMLTVMATCFAPVERDEWEQLTEPQLWAEFLAAVRGALQAEGTFDQLNSYAKVGPEAGCPLGEFLSEREVEALRVPPAYDEKRAFAARHFTGGLPSSAMPVESLYTAWSNSPQPAPFSKSARMYQGDSARYLRDLVERLGLEVPPQFAGYPDHLALELDLMAVLLRSGARAEARQFAAERFGWLAAYRRRLLELGEDAWFYIGLVDVLVGIHAQLETATDEGAGEGPRERTEVTQDSASNIQRSHACI